jgi:hypothetical protein
VINDTLGKVSVGCYTLVILSWCNWKRPQRREDDVMQTRWTHTRAVLQQLSPGDTSKYLAQLIWKGPQIVAQARTLMQAYPLSDDRFKIHMIHYLRQTLPGGLEPLYEAMLRDIMADKPQLQG